MALDPSIITSGQQVKLPTLGDLVALQASQAQYQQAQQGTQLNAVKLQQAQRGLKAQSTLADLYRQNTGPDGTVNTPAISQGMAAAGFGDQVPDLQEQGQKLALGAQQVQAGATANSASDFALKKQKVDTINQSLSSLLSDPNTTPNSVVQHISSWVDQGLIDPNTGAQMVQKVPGPQGLRQWLVQAALQGQSVDKQLSAMAPTDQRIDTGGQIVQGQAPSEVTRLVNPNAPGFTPVGPAINKTMSPDQAAMLKMKQTQMFSPDDGDLLATLAEHGISLPAGMRSKEQQLATVRALRVQNPDLSNDEIATKIGTGQINFNSDKKAATVAAGQEGKVSTAVNELGPMGDQALAASAAVPRGSFVPFNKLIQMADSSISDPNLLTLKIKLNALNNAYNVLSARGGTDAGSRAHVAQLFSSANSPEGVAALVAGLKQEGAVAQAAAAKASHVGTPPAAAAPTDVPPDIAAILAKHGGG